MGSAPARLAIIVAAVVVGAVVIGKGFETPAAGGSKAHPTPSASTSASATPSSGTSPQPTGNDNGPKATREGVVLALLNATSTDGLASSSGNDLKKLGYVIKVEANSPTASTTTIVYFKDEQGKADAGLLKKELTNNTEIQKITPGQIQGLNQSLDSPMPDSVELIVVLGNDYASTHPVSNG